MTTPRILVEIAASFGSFQADFGKAARTAEQNARQIQRSIDDIKRKGAELAKGLAAAVGVPLSAGALIATLDSIKQKTIEGERAVNMLEATLRATGNAAGFTAQGIDEIGAGLQKSTYFDDDAIRSAATALLRFRTIQKDVFADTLRLTPDVATALGTDLPTAAQALGRALTDPESGMKALRAAGVRLGEQQQDLAARLIETGDKASAQRIVLDEVAKSVGGLAEGDNKGLYGASRRLTRALDDLSKQAGKTLFAGTVKESDVLTGFFERLTERMKTMGTVREELGRIFANPLAFAIQRGKEFATGLPPEQPGRSASGKIGGLPDNEQLKADLAALEQESAQRRDQAYREQQAALKRRASSSAAYYLGELQTQRAALEVEQTQTEFAYSQGERSAEEHFAKLRDIAARDAQATLTNLGKQGQDIEAALQATSTSREERLALEERIRGIADQQDKTRLDLKQRLLTLDNQQVAALRRLDDEYAGLQVRLLELSGDTVGAAAAGFSLSNRGLQDRIDAQKRSPDAAARINAQVAQQRLDDERRLVVQQAEMNKAQADFGLILDEIGIKQARIDIARRSGSITELDALAQASVANKARIADLDRVAAAYEEVAKATGDPKALVAAEQLRLKIEELSASADLLGDKFRGVFVDGLSGPLADFISGTKSASDAFKSFTNNITQSLARIAAQNIAESLFGKQGVGGGLGSLIGGLFGGGDSGSGGSSGSGLIGNVLGKFLGGGAGGFDIGTYLAGLLLGGGGPLGFATGTNFAPGGVALVGERGPELVNLPRGAQVIPNSELVARRGARGGVTNHFHINVLPGASRATGEQAALATGRAVTAAIRNNG